MVCSVRHWCTAAGLIRAKADRTQFEPTALGKAIFADDRLDPYLGDMAILWLIHAQPAMNTNRATTWYWAFNVFAQNEFRKARFTSNLIGLKKTGRAEVQIKEGNRQCRKKRFPP